MDHDQNFKNLILDYPHDALEFFASREAQHISRDVRITPIREEQLKDRLGDRFRELDVPLLVEWPDGAREAVLFVLEEESDTKRFSIHRLAHYCLDLSELMKTDRVVPVVIFLRLGEFPSKLALGTELRTYLSFDFIRITLADLWYEEYRESNNIVALLNLPNMRYRPDQRVDVYAAAVRGFRRREPDPNKLLKYLDFVDMYAALDEEERKVYILKYPEEANIMTTFAERFRNEGRDEGRQDMLLDALNMKFHSVPQEIQDKVFSLKDPPKLKDLLQYVFLCDDLGQFQDKLNRIAG